MTTWPHMRMKYLVDINQMTLPEVEDPERIIRYLDITSVGQGTLLANPTSMAFGEAPSRARRLVAPGDTIVSTVRTYLRSVWPVVGETAGLVVSTGFAVLTPRQCLDPRFLGWWAQGSQFIEQVVARSVGVSYPSINVADIGNIPMPVPPIQQQGTVACYLDTQTSRLDTLIEKKQHMIRLLDERSQAIISAAVGASFLPTPSRQPETTCTLRYARLGSVSRIQTGLTLDAGRDTQGEELSLPYLRVANVQDGSLDLKELKNVAVSRALAARYTLRPRDVLMTEGGDPDKLGRGTVWPGDVTPCLHQNHIFAVRPSSELLPEYLALVTRTRYARAYFEMTASKTTGIASTSTSKIASFRLPLPSIEEQKKIVEELDGNLDKIASIKERLVTQIARVKEHRRSLITAAVTGELDIPGLAK